MVYEARALQENSNLTMQKYQLRNSDRPEPCVADLKREMVNLKHETRAQIPHIAKRQFPFRAGLAPSFEILLCRNVHLFSGVARVPAYVRLRRNGDSYHMGDGL